jgi:hypothetical protein
MAASIREGTSHVQEAPGEEEEDDEENNSSDDGFGAFDEFYNDYLSLSDEQHYNIINF